MSDPKVNKTPNKVTIASGVVKRVTFSGTQVNTELHRCINNAVASESNTRENVMYIPLLVEVDTNKYGTDPIPRK
jgi:hypothetical protein